MAEVHLIGHILEARDFDEDRSLYIKWTLSAGSCWRPIEGYTEGQTQLAVGATLIPTTIDRLSNEIEDEVENGATICHSFSHPLDVHYATRGLQGWPRFEFQVWGVDWLGKCNISAYGFMSVPAKPGYHELTCYTWRPVGDLRRRFIDYLTGYRMHLIEPTDIVANGLNRHMIQALSMGSIKVQLTVVLKDFEDYGVDI